MQIPENPDPIDLFTEWLDEAKTHDEIIEPTAMTLATVDADGMPWPRIVLLKDVSDQGFTFYTNLGSLKAQQLDAIPKAGLCFHWMPLNQQVRILGDVERVDDAAADTYFDSRPRESQLGAWASKQSTAMASREELLQSLADYTAKFEGQDVPRPSFWSGYRLKPSFIEFWLRAPFRLHHRRAYTRKPDGSWTQEILYP